MSWINFSMDLATIPSGDPNKKEEDVDEHIEPDDEEEVLRKMIGL